MSYYRGLKEWDKMPGYLRDPLRPNFVIDYEK